MADDDGVYGPDDADDSDDDQDSDDAAADGGADGDNGGDGGADNNDNGGDDGDLNDFFSDPDDLDELYLKGGLPPLSAQKPGEEAMPHRQNLTAFAAAVRVPKRIPKAAAKKA